MCTVCISNNINRNVYMYLNTRIFPTTGHARVLLFMFIRRELRGTGTGCLFQFTYCVYHLICVQTMFCHLFFSVDLAQIATFVSRAVCYSAVSDYSTHVFFFFIQSFNFFLFICLIIIMSYYLVISNLLSFNVYFTPKGEFQICPRIDFDNILYVEYLRYNNCKNEIILFLKDC